MLRPQHTTTRECLPLNGVWDFNLDASGEGTTDHWYASPLRDPSPMAVPASYNDLSAADDVRDHVGDVWYQRRVRTIARDRNHPCVVTRSIANEPESGTEASERYLAPLFDVARERDPTRPVGFVNLGSAPHGQCRVSRFADLIMINRYWGWYVAAGDLAEAERVAREELEGRATENKPIIITEYGADAVTGSTCTRRCRGRRNTRWRCSTCCIACSTPSTPSWASTCGTSPTSPRSRASRVWPATRRARSPATDSPSCWPATCAAAGRVHPASTLPDRIH
ncbi:hypothetical protein GCM10028815_24040 [Mariniluteicoccus flavus]